MSHRAAFQHCGQRQPRCVCPHSKTLWALPNTKQYPLIQAGPWVLLRKCVCMLGGRGGVSIGDHYLREMRARVNRSGRGHRDAAFFWMKLLHTHPLPILSRIHNVGTSLVEPPSHWRQTGSLVAESARRSIHSASDKRSGEVEEEEMQAVPSERLTQLWWRQEERSCWIHRNCPYLNWHRASHWTGITASPSFDLRRAEGWSIRVLQRSQGIVLIR